MMQSNLITYNLQRSSIKSYLIYRSLIVKNKKWTAHRFYKVEPPQLWHPCWLAAGPFLATPTLICLIYIVIQIVFPFTTSNWDSSFSRTLVLGGNQYFKYYYTIVSRRGYIWERSDWQPWLHHRAYLYFSE